MWNDSLTRRKLLRSTGKVSLGVFIGAGTALEVLASQSALVELVVTDWFSFTITVSWPTNPGNDSAFDPYYEALSNEIQTATLRFTHKVHYKWKVVNLSQEI